MKKEIHPTYEETKFSCICGNHFTIGSTMKGEVKLDICSNCHPLYSGQHDKVIDTEGRIEKFNRKYKRN